jgi:hypothetical protein
MTDAAATQRAALADLERAERQALSGNFSRQLGREI